MSQVYCVSWHEPILFMRWMRSQACLHILPRRLNLRVASLAMCSSHQAAGDSFKSGVRLCCFVVSCISSKLIIIP